MFPLAELRYARVGSRGGGEGIAASRGVAAQALGGERLAFATLAGFCDR
jgi:hypothetical protein